MSDSDSELEPSELGTKSFWQNQYTKEIGNFTNHGDPGEIWFGEDSAIRVIEWIVRCCDDRFCPIVDLGCGNGHTLIELARQGFTDLLGLDYCEEAIQLAKKVAEKEFSSIKYEVFDVTKGNVSDLPSRFSLVHDKGTYDAISLNPENASDHRRRYIENVCKMLKDDGIFVITSCNWTEEELKTHFQEKLEVKDVIPTPQFKFGGKTGSMISSVVFEKNNKV